jgi:hypothetical protein
MGGKASFKWGPVNKREYIYIGIICIYTHKNHKHVHMVLYALAKHINHLVQTRTETRSAMHVLEFFPYLGEWHHIFMMKLDANSRYSCSAEFVFATPHHNRHTVTPFHLSSVQTTSFWNRSNWLGAHQWAPSAFSKSPKFSWTTIITYTG